MRQSLHPSPENKHCTKRLFYKHDSSCSCGRDSGIGSVVANAIASTKKHDVFVLSRKITHEPTDASITIISVNYDLVDHIEHVLTSHNIDTVLSRVPLNFEAESASQINLIRAAAKSPTVKRFEPSEFGINYMEAAQQNYPFPSTSFKWLRLRSS
ncbi:hypothetical protein J3459_015253 [Metarhizium acridum]|nr:hypothetical protein J3459_015253 [Metarhizium acridum]